MATIGVYDCANPKCSAYHGLVERRITTLHNRCQTCRKPLRLVRVKRTMDEAAKRRLRELSARGAA